MDVNEFIRTLKSDKNYVAIKKGCEDIDIFNSYLAKLQDKFLSRKYIPYAEKTLLVEKIVNNTSYTEIEGQRVTKVNTPQRSYLFLLAMLDNYTKLDVDFNKGLEIFDAIQKDEDARFIMQLIPQSEYEIMTSLLEMAVDDFITNNMNITSYLDTKIAALNISGGAILDMLSELAEKQLGDSNVENNL